MRHIPEAGAVCGNSARTDLCGGRGVTSVPTATVVEIEAKLLSCIPQRLPQDLANLLTLSAFFQRCNT